MTTLALPSSDSVLERNELNDIQEEKTEDWMSECLRWGVVLSDVNYFDNLSLSSSL